MGFFGGFCLNIFTSVSHEVRKYEIKDNEVVVTSDSIAEVAELIESGPTEADSTATIEKAAGNVAPLATDTVREGYYFTTMAKKYYGDKIFWAYIYEKNADKLGHPERTQPGTVVVIPAPEEYGIDKNNPSSVADARKKGAEIYQRHQ